MTGTGRAGPDSPTVATQAVAKRDSRESADTPRAPAWQSPTVSQTADRFLRAPSTWPGLPDTTKVDAATATGLLRRFTLHVATRNLEKLTGQPRDAIDAPPHAAAYLACIHGQPQALGTAVEAWPAAPMVTQRMRSLLAMVFLHRHQLSGMSDVEEARVLAELLSSYTTFDFCRQLDALFDREPLRAEQVATPPDAYAALCAHIAESLALQSPGEEVSLPVACRDSTFFLGVRAAQVDDAPVLRCRLDDRQSAPAPLERTFCIPADARRDIEGLVWDVVVCSARRHTRQGAYERLSQRVEALRATYGADQVYPRDDDDISRRPVTQPTVLKQYSAAMRARLGPDLYGKVKAHERCIARELCFGAVFSAGHFDEALVGRRLARLTELLQNGPASERRLTRLLEQPHYRGLPALLPASVVAAVIAQGDVATLQPLIQAGLDWTVHDADGATVLHWAVRQRKGDVVRCLLQGGASVNRCDSRGRTPLHDAVAGRQSGLAKLLVEYGANPDQADRSGVTPNMLAADPSLSTNG